MQEFHQFTVRSIERLEGVKRQHPKSIHPFGRREKSNTSKAKSPGVIARVRAALEGHLAHHPGDHVSAAHLSKLG